LGSTAVVWAAAREQIKVRIRVARAVNMSDLFIVENLAC